MKNLRKFFAVSVMALTIFAMSGISPVKATAQAGDLIKKDGLSTVYYLGADGKRYVFPHDSVYFTWYADFSGVVTVDATELSSYPLGANVVMRPGTKLVKITTDPSVYAVEADGVLRKIQSEADAITLYGADWAKRVIDVADSFFTNYTIGTPLTSGEVPAGTLVKVAGDPAVYYYDGTTYRNITTEAAFNANRFNFANLITVAAIGTAGTAITGAETAFTKTSQAGVTPGQQPGAGTGLTVALSSLTPSSINIPANSPVDFLKLNLTAASDGNVSVTSIKLTAYDLGDAIWVDDVTFYDSDGVKLGTSKNINNDRYAIFNFATPIVVNAGTTKTLTVRAGIGTNSGGLCALAFICGGNYILGIATGADVVATGATVSGSFPIKGNSMAAVNGASVGSVTIGAVTNDQLATNNFGNDNVLLAGFDLTAVNEDILAQTFRLYNSGTNDTAVMDNIKLYADGTEIATGSYNDRYVTFTLTNYKIIEGDTVSFEVRGDIGVTSVGDWINLYIKNRADFTFVGQTFGFSAQIDDVSYLNLNAANDGIKTTLAAGAFTIDFDRSATTGTPAKDVKAGDNDVILGTLLLESNSENVTVESIIDDGANTFEIQGLDLDTDGIDEIENLEMYDVSTGGVYDIAFTANATTTHLSLSMMDEISLTKGVARKFLIRADMSDSAGHVIDNGDTLKVHLDSAAMTITGDVSGAPIVDITPASVDSAITTIKDASLTWTTVGLTNKTVVGGAADVELYRASLKAGTSDSVKLQTIKLTTLATTTVFADTNITKLDLYLNNHLIKTVSNDIVESTGAVVNNTISFGSLNATYSTIAAAATVDLVVKATFASTLTLDDQQGGNNLFALELSLSGDATVRLATTNTLVLVNAGGATAGGSRNVTLQGVGTLQVDLLTTDVKADRDSYVLAGAETAATRYIGELKFTTANEAIKVTRLVLTATSTADAISTDLSAIKLYKYVAGVPTLVASAIPEANGDVIFDPFDVVFPADQATSLFIAVVAKGMNVDADPTATAASSRFIAYNIDDVDANGDNSGTALVMVADPTPAANQYADATVATKKTTIVGSILNSITNPMADGTLTGGIGKILGKYTFVFDNGANRNLANGELKAQFSTTTITFAKSTNVQITDVQAYLEGTLTKVAATDQDAAGIGATGTTAGLASWDDDALLALSGGGAVDGTVTLIIVGTVTTSADDGEYIQTSIADLNGAATDDIMYVGDGELGGTILQAMYLPVTEVIGATLHE